MLGLLAFWAMSIPTSLVMQYGALYKMTGLAANNGYLINKEHNNENMYSDLIRVIIENTPEFDLYTVFPLLNLITSLNFSPSKFLMSFSVLGFPPGLTIEDTPETV